MSFIDVALEDFNNAISSRGLAPSDFELTEYDEPMHGVDVQPLISHVTVQRKSTGVTKIYSAGNFSHWVVDFIQDLNRGVFD